MTDLDSFRTALQAPPVEPLGGLDIGRIVAAGGRIRRQRRVAGTALILAVVAALIGSVSYVDVWRHRVGSEVGSPLSAGPAPAPAPKPVPTRTRPTPARTTAPPTPTPLGDVVPTGIADPAGMVVLYAVGIDDPVIPLTHFGVAAGYRDPAGGITQAMVVNESDGADDAVGFHTTEGLAGLSGIPEFGYYVGPAIRITGRVGGRTVVAGQARWSRDPRVVLFWFAPGDLGGRDAVDLAAFDPDGRTLPVGDNRVFHG
jgi:hypothetical protein